MSRLEEFDLIVIGAGPAGSTLATMVRKHNPEARVLILEKSPFPRHHIGESLLPGSIPVLKEMGVYDAIRAAGFPRKFGAVFVWGKDRAPWDADFNNINLEMLEKYGALIDTEFSWQVLRSRYDEILLDHARSCGAEVRFGLRAVEPVERGGRIAGVVVEGPDGRRSELRSRILADCSGQNGFLSRFMKTRTYRDELKNAASYAYFKGARWKFRFVGHPDKTKIFVCSVPQGWFWYIPISQEIVSVGLVSKVEYIRRNAIKDQRAFYFDALRACPEIWPLVEGAELMKGIDPQEPEKEFFSAADWSYESAAACGEGWLAAGDAAFFIDPLLSSGVMMAHLSGHRAAYTINTAWRQSDPAAVRRLWSDYDRFCKEVAGSFMALVRYWYSHEPCAESWWKEGTKALRASTPLDLSDKMSFVSIAAGVNYYFERAYTNHTFVFGSQNVEHSWQWEGTKLELKNWTRQILAIVETGFLKRPSGSDGRSARAAELARLEAIPDSWVPAWAAEKEIETAFLPDSRTGTLRPVRRAVFKLHAGGDAGLHAANPKRVLPLSYLAVLDAVDGRATVGEIKAGLYGRLALPKETIDGQVFRLLKDLGVIGAIRFDGAEAPAAPAFSAEPWAAGADPDGWRLMRAGEKRLLEGRCQEAEDALSAAVEAGREEAWVFALRGETRRHLGRRAEALADLDRAVRLNEGPSGAEAATLEESLAAHDAELRRDWIKDRIRLLRGKLRLELGDVPGAIADLDCALAANPRQSEALVLRAKAQRRLGRLELAHRDLKAAQEIESRGARNQG